jgi:transcriptional regulator with XRE-family HTH domain
MDGKNLQLKRIERGWTQKRLSEEAKVSDITISSIERGVANPSPLTMAKLATALNLPVDFFWEKLSD